MGAGRILFCINCSSGQLGIHVSDFWLYCVASRLAFDDERVGVGDMSASTAPTEEVAAAPVAAAATDEDEGDGGRPRDAGAIDKLSLPLSLPPEVVPPPPPPPCGGGPLYHPLN